MFYPGVYEKESQAMRDLRTIVKIRGGILSRHPVTEAEYVQLAEAMDRFSRLPTSLAVEIVVGAQRGNRPLPNFQ